MCGRFTQALSWAELVDLYNLSSEHQPVNLRARWNGAPAQEFAILRRENGRAEVLLMSWGISPRWAKRPLINARAETIHTKPSFRNAFFRRRCLIPANGWFEWTNQPEGKQPWWISLRSGKPFSFGAIWETPGEGSEQCKFSIVTQSATGELRNVHHRQPAIIPQADYGVWLSTDQDPERLVEIANKSLAGPFEARRVGKAVNSTRNDAPEILEPLPESPG